MKIAGKYIHPYGKNGRELWEKIKGNCFVKRGAKKVLMTYLQGSEEFDSESEFAKQFEAVLGLKGLIKDVSDISRPKWPDSYRKILGVMKGDNIRHIVRNAAIKNALVDEYEQLMQMKATEKELKEYYSSMAETLGVKVSKDEHSGNMLKKIYEKLYLHLGNLFAGVGGDNQLIGFAADPIEALGFKLEELETKEVDIAATFAQAAKIIGGKFKAVAARAKEGGTIKELEELYSVIETFLKERAAEWVNLAKGETIAAEELADDFIDIGQTFSFDLIVQRDRDKGTQEIHKKLIAVQTILNSEEIHPGTSRLTEVFQSFLQAGTSSSASSSVKSSNSNNNNQNEVKTSRNVIKITSQTLLTGALNSTSSSFPPSQIPNSTTNVPITNSNLTTSAFSASGTNPLNQKQS